MLYGMELEFTGGEILWETIQQMEDYPIYRLTYLSSAADTFTDADLNDIESKSLAANHARDVTGLLIVNGKHILQILEGRESAVCELYAKISKDPRHSITKLVSTIEDEGRLLMSWNLVVRDAATIPLDVQDQYRRFYVELINAEQSRAITIEDVEFLQTISLFSTLPA
jgi:hypothetical protein